MNELGIIMLDTKFPRFPGDVGNPQSYSYPIRIEKVKTMHPQKVVYNGNMDMLEPFIEAGRKLERLGVQAITTSCGFLAMFQKELSTVFSVPVFTSSLIQAKLVADLIGKNRKIGIITANSKTLGTTHFEGAGIQNINKVVYGMEDTEFSRIYVQNNVDCSYDMLEKDMLFVAEKMVAEHTDIGAIVFECTNMPPFASVVQDRIKKPVYDIITLANYVMSGLARKKYTN